MSTTAWRTSKTKKRPSFVDEKVTILGTIPKGELNQIRIRLVEGAGYRSIDLRAMYKKHANEPWSFSKSGIRVQLSEVESVISAFQKGLALTRGETPQADENASPQPSAAAYNALAAGGFGVTGGAGGSVRSTASGGSKARTRQYQRGRTK
jgi:hypothetical protein